MIVFGALGEPCTMSGSGVIAMSWSIGTTAEGAATSGAGVAATVGADVGVIEGEGDGSGFWARDAEATKTKASASEGRRAIRERAVTDAPGRAAADSSPAKIAGFRGG